MTEQETQQQQLPDLSREGGKAREAVKKHILTTRSVNSPVLPTTDTDISDVSEGRCDPIGHVMLVDYDVMQVEQLNSDLAELEGVTIVAESSEDSYHAWNLTVRSKEDTALRLLETRTDMGHVGPGYRRGYWRLRIGPKVRISDEIYKPRPSLRAVVVNEPVGRQSLAHWSLAKGLWPDRMPDERPDAEWIGSAFTSSEYATFTDELKGALYDEEDE